MVSAAGGDQLDAMTTGLDNAAANPLPHHAWRSGEARCQDGVSGFSPESPIENVGQHATVDGALA
jgi:hypothetical protein